MTKIGGKQEKIFKKSYLWVTWGTNDPYLTEVANFNWIGPNYYDFENRKY